MKGKRQAANSLCVLIVLPASIFLHSCRCSCECDKYLGCKIMTVKQKSTGNVISTKIFCAQTNFYSDKALQDSVTNFINQYQNDSTTVASTDSIYHHDSIHKIECDETQSFERDGYNCNCAK